MSRQRKKRKKIAVGEQLPDNVKTPQYKALEAFLIANQGFVISIDYRGNLFSVIRY